MFSNRSGKIRLHCFLSIQVALCKAVILYAPNYKSTPAQDIINVGGYVVRTQEELLELISIIGA